jgi:predicted O-methyltransferase YrrM
MLGGPLEPFTVSELLEEYEREHDAISKHLLTIYSIIIGLQAQRVAEIGVGGTTRTLRAALARTGGELYSCDADVARWEPVARENRDPRFHLSLADSRPFIASLRGPFDFVLHDGAHDLWQVKWDLEHIWPLVRQFGIICVHDTQHNRVGRDMQRALLRAFQGCPVSWTHLPYSYGLTIVRIEREQPYEPLTGHWNKAGGASFTAPATCGVVSDPPMSTAADGMRDGLSLIQSRLRAGIIRHPSLFTVAKLVRDRLHGRGRR